MLSTIAAVTSLARQARNERGGDHDVLGGDVACHQLRLLRLIFARHFLGVAARGFGLLEFLVLDGDELRAKACHLLLGGGPHVGRRDNCTEALAVAMACKPATPTPMMKTRAAGTVPAAVIIIGKARPNWAAASMTAL